MKQLYELARENSLDLTTTEIAKWYREQPVNQIFKTEQTMSNIPFFAKKVGQIQADLIDIHLLARKNDGYKWILTVMDVKTRFGWAFPLKKKDPKEVLIYLKIVDRELFISKSSRVSDSQRNRRFLKAKGVVTLTVDDGGEFKGVVKKWCIEKDIPIWIANPVHNTKTRTALVESFNRFLLRKMFKWMKANNNYRWVDRLHEFVANCNKSHSLNKNYESGQVLVNPFEIGDSVRVVIPRTVFSKPTREPTWSDEVYRIYTRDHARWVLTDSNYKVIPLHYLPRQLLKVPHLISTPISMAADELVVEKADQRVITKQRQTNLDTTGKDIVIPKRLKVDGKRKAKVPSRYRV